MAVTTVLRGLGSWGINLREDTPKKILDALRYFGHIAINAGYVDPRTSGDALLRNSRYTGVYRTRKDRDDGSTDIGGVGMAVWLGDEDGKGAVIETLMTFVNEPFHTAIPQLLPISVTAGTIFNIGQNFTGTFQFVNPRQAIDYIAQTTGAVWRVNGDATVDAGLEADLFVTVPKIIVARNHSGRDLRRRAFNGALNTDQDVEDFTTRVVLLATDPDGSHSTGNANILPGLNVYKDLFGNSVKMTRIVSETGTSLANAPARAQLQLNRFTGTRDALDLNSDEYDIPGDIEVGDYIWVWDPDKKIQDYANEVYAPWGELINPRKLQLTEMVWPIDDTMSVSFRDEVGGWHDLTPYFLPESGTTSIVVGGYNRSLTSGDGGAATQPPPPEANLSIPGVVSWVPANFKHSVYQSVGGETKAQSELVWLQPNNTDTTNITDGDHYEIRYRTSTIPVFPVTYNQMEVFTYNQLKLNGGTFGQPIHYPVTEWMYLYVPFDKQRVILYELTASMPYEAQIRALDTGSMTSPANAGAWSALTAFQTSADTLAPFAPAPPAVATSLIAVEITHTLGRADGGTYNLDADIHHLEIHGGVDPSFTPVDGTLLGKLLVNYGMVVGHIPAVGTFNINEVVPVWFKVIAVDAAGNKSLPSSAVSQTATLVDNAHISSLIVSKVTAGTMTASWIVGGRIATMSTGNWPGVEMTSSGLRGRTISGVTSLDWESATGILKVLGQGGIKVLGGGNVEVTDGAVIIKNALGNKIIEMGECADGRHGLQVYTDAGVRVTRIGELASGSEGIEVISDTGELVRVDTLAFGLTAANNAGAFNTSSAVYTGSSPGVTVPIGNSGKCAVYINSWIIPGEISGGLVGSAQAGFYGAGPGGATYAADDNQAVSAERATFGVGRSFLAQGLTPGSWTFNMTYKSGATVTASSFINRMILAQPF